MSKIEKMLLATVVLLMVFAVTSFMMASRAIEEAGGARKVVVEAGKEIKSIAEEINTPAK